MVGFRGGGTATSLFTRFRPSRLIIPGGASSDNTASTGGTTKSNAGIGSTTTGFTPRLICSQMIALQSFHYTCLSLLLQINHVLLDTPITVDRIFTTRSIHIWSIKSWKEYNTILVFSHVMGAYFLLWIVEKSRKCLDFATTLFFIHFVLTCLYNYGFPTSFDWWILHVFATLIMTLFGEYLCSKRELEDIPLL